jgi:hypothetical protein
MSQIETVLSKLAGMLPWVIDDGSYPDPEAAPMRVRLLIGLDPS